MAPNNSHTDVGKGVGLLLLMHVFCFPVILAVIAFLTRKGDYYLFSPWLVASWFIGILQFIYVLPALIYFDKRSRPDLMKGIAIGALITLLLNGGCFVVVFAGAG